MYSEFALFTFYNFIISYFNVSLHCSQIIFAPVAVCFQLVKLIFYIFPFKKYFDNVVCFGVDRKYQGGLLMKVEFRVIFKPISALGSRGKT